jgi:hypothetical protein
MTIDWYLMLYRNLLSVFVVAAAVIASVNLLAAEPPISTAVGQATTNSAPAGFESLFNGRDLTGWLGLVSTPPKRTKLTAEELAAAQEKANETVLPHWSAADGVLTFDGAKGEGFNLCTAKDYGDFELYVEWKIDAVGDSGIYLRGSPQVQIWDPASRSARGIGSGGLFNNQKNPKDPLVKADKPIGYADKPIGEWNSFFIRMQGDKVFVWLNDQLVVDNTPLENYWERDKPIYPTGKIELQSHASKLSFRNIYARELDSALHGK